MLSHAALPTTEGAGGRGRPHGAGYHYYLLGHGDNPSVPPLHTGTSTVQTFSHLAN